jgi:hypothetical protein
MQKRYITGEKNCSIFYTKTMLTSVAFRKHLYSTSSIYCLVSLAFMLFLTSVITPPFFLSFLSLLKTWCPLIPVRTQQAGAAYGSLTRRSPTNATGDEQGKILAEKTSIQSKKNT